MNTAITITLIICITLVLLYVISCVRDVKMAKHIDKRLAEKESRENLVKKFFMFKDD